MSDSLPDTHCDEHELQEVRLSVRVVWDNSGLCDLPHYNSYKLDFDVDTPIPYVPVCGKNDMLTFAEDNLDFCARTHDT